MQNNIRNTNLRFNLGKEQQRRAWEYLQTMDRQDFKSYSQVISLALVDYFDRYYRTQADPYLETREQEELFVKQIVDAVEYSLKQSLPLFLSGLTAGTNLLSYMMFPRFLLDMEINETAKMLYIILLDRARLSQKNEGWSDTDGHVFIYFTIEALAEVLHKSQMTVKTALAVLEKQELIFRKRQGPGQPNRIYLKTSGLQDKALYDYTFARDNGINPEIKLAHNYVSNWEEMKANTSGLLIWGDIGTGKSFFAGCIANALLEKGVPVLMTNFSRILNTLTGMHFEDRNQFINGLNRYSLLIIDDLGIERNSDFALEQVFNVIDSRYRSKKPLIITTNLTLSELNNAADIAHKRIYDRILERCIPVRINNRNIRQDNATANLKQAKRILLNNHAPNQN